MKKNVEQKEENVYNSTMQYFYKVVLEEAEEGGFTAYVPSLPGCISEGDTYEEAMENIKEALSLYLETAKERNMPITADKTHITELCVNL